MLSQSVRIYREAGISVVLQDGSTGLVAGATPDETGLQVVISTAAMKKIRTVDPVDMSVAAEAGATIAEPQNAAPDAGALFPSSLASEGTVTIGGMLATNAAGMSAVLGRQRYVCTVCDDDPLHDPAARKWADGPLKPPAK